MAIEHLEGLDWRTPRVRPWPLCCEANRMRPLVTYMRGITEPCAFINGQRQSDNGTTPARMAGIMPPHVENVLPLWAWSTADVLAYIEAHAIPLPPHHDMLQGSMECAICPADIQPSRLRVLDKFEPHAAAFVRSTVRISLGLVAARAREIEAVLDEGMRGPTPAAPATTVPLTVLSDP